MSKDWQRGSTFMNDDVKIEKELGVWSLMVTQTGETNQ